MPGLHLALHGRGRRVLWLSTLAALVLSGSLFASPAAAQASESPDWAYRLPYDLMSPFCPGRTLADCPSPQAAELKVWILTQAAAGASREEVMESLLQRFGDGIRSAPRPEGFGLTAYLLPVLGGLLGAAIVAFALRRLVAASPGAARPEPRAPSSSPPLADAPIDEAELARQVDEELARTG